MKGPTQRLEIGVGISIMRPRFPLHEHINVLYAPTHSTVQARWLRLVLSTILVLQPHVSPSHVSSIWLSIQGKGVRFDSVLDVTVCLSDDGGPLTQPTSARFATRAIPRPVTFTDMDEPAKTIFTTSNLVAQRQH